MERKKKVKKMQQECILVCWLKCYGARMRSYWFNFIIVLHVGL